MRIARAESIAGGDIHDAWRVELADGGRVFVKIHAALPPGMYAAEAAGLAWLAEGRGGAGPGKSRGEQAARPHCPA